MPSAIDWWQILANETSGAGGVFYVAYRRHEVAGILPRIDSQPRPGVPFSGTGKSMAIELNHAMPSYLSGFMTLDGVVAS
jgi:hypothetical protein